MPIIHKPIAANAVKHGNTCVLAGGNRSGDLKCVETYVSNTPTTGDIETQNGHRFDNPRYYTGDSA